jgi:hypothetical protein
MSFLKSLFGRRSEVPRGGTATAAKELEHNGFLIKATPYKEGGQFQTAGVIEKEIGGVRREQRFVRVDKFSSVTEAADFSLLKGRQIVDEQGDGLFK